MSQRLLDRLDPSNRVLKRAQYEAFEFSLLDGDVRVRNESHLDPADHDYRVDVDDHVPVSCACPADAAFEGPCKHRVAVAIRPRILDLAMQMRAVAAAGDVDSDEYRPSQADGDVDCDCAELRGEFPCWECVRTGRRDLPE